jgi:hypothetical protein
MFVVDCGSLRAYVAIGAIGLFGLLSTSALHAETAPSLAYAATLSDIGIKWEPSGAPLVLHNAKVPQPKSEWVALGYAVFPGYFIPAAFGHAYAGANVTAGLLSAGRLSGRIMWMYSFFENFWVDGADGAISGAEMALFYVGLALDLGGYLYDIVRAPAEVARYNQRLALKQPRVSPFIDIVDDGPCCGLAFQF